MIDPISIQAQFNDPGSGLADKIGRDVGPYTVALLSVFGSGQNEILGHCGSGSLVSVGDADYILTAFHVWQLCEGAMGLGLTLDEEDVDHSFFIDMKLIVPFGPKQIFDWNSPRGPDMVLLEIPPQYLSRLKKAKRFYDMTVDVPELPKVSSLDVYIVIGSPGEQSKKLPKHASLTMNAIFATSVRSIPTKDSITLIWT